MVPAAAEPVSCEGLHDSAGGQPKVDENCCTLFTLNCYHSLDGTMANQGLLYVPFIRIEEGLEDLQPSNHKTLVQTSKQTNKQTCFCCDDRCSSGGGSCCSCGCRLKFMD